MNEDVFFMNQALLCAQKADKLNEVPVGCVIVYKGKVIARGYNRRERKKNPLAHAEIIAIEKAAKKLGGYRLLDCTMYVTLEPCPMCAGAIINARIPRLVFGAHDKKAGCFGSVHDFNISGFNHTLDIKSGVCKQECSGILTEFFKKLRGSSR